jgi:protein-tyrosine phosphatase
VKILFVCLGNICRSPTAEVVFRAVASREAPQIVFEIDSAGTAGYHVGEQPDRRARSVDRS